MQLITSNNSLCRVSSSNSFHPDFLTRPGERLLARNNSWLQVCLINHTSKLHNLEIKRPRRRDSPKVTDNKIGLSTGERSFNLTYRRINCICDLFFACYPIHYDNEHTCLRHRRSFDCGSVRCRPTGQWLCPSSDGEEREKEGQSQD